MIKKIFILVIFNKNLHENNFSFHCFVFSSILLVLSLSLNAQNDDQKRIKNLKDSLNFIKEDTTKVNIILDLFEVGGFKDLSESKYYLDTSLQLSFNKNYYYGISRSYQKLGKYYFLCNDYYNSIVYFSNSINYYKKLRFIYPENYNYFFGLITVLIDVGTAYAYNKNFDKAYYYYKYSLKLLLSQKEKIVQFKNKIYIDQLYNLIGTDYFYIAQICKIIKNNNNKYQKYLLKAISSYELINNYKAIINISFNYLEDYNQTIKYCRDAFYSNDTSKYYFMENFAASKHELLFGKDINNRLAWLIDEISFRKSKDTLIDLFSDLSFYYMQIYLREAQLNIQTVFSNNLYYIKSLKYTKLLLDILERDSYNTEKKTLQEKITSIEKDNKYTQEQYEEAVTHLAIHLLYQVEAKIDNISEKDYDVYSFVFTTLIQSAVNPNLIGSDEFLDIINNKIIPAYVSIIKNQLQLENKINYNYYDKQGYLSSTNYFLFTLFNVQAIFFDILKDYKKVLDALIKAKPYINNITDIEQVYLKTEYFKSLSKAYYCIKDYNNAELYCDSALLYYSKIENDSIRIIGLGKMHFQKALIYKNLNNDTSFLEEINNSTVLLSQANDIETLPKIFYEKGIYYTKRGGYNIADSLYKTSISYFFKLFLSDSSRYTSSYEYSSSLLYTFLNYAKNKAKMGLIEEAFNIIEEKRKIIQHDYTLNYFLGKYVADIYFEKKDYKEALVRFYFLSILNTDFNKLDNLGEDVVFNTYIDIFYKCAMSGYLCKNNNLIDTNSSWLSSSVKVVTLALNKIDEFKKICLRNNSKFEFYKYYYVFSDFLKIAFNNSDKSLLFFVLEKSKSQVLYSLINEKNASESMLPDSINKIKDKIQYSINLFKAKDDIAKNIEFIEYYDTLINYIEKIYPEYYNLKYSNKVASLDDIKNILDPNQSIIEYFVGDSLLSIFYISKDTMLVHLSNINNESFETLVSNYRNEIFNGVDSNTFYTFQFISNELYRILLSPFEEHIKDSSSLIIIPDGVLYGIPFEALVTNPIKNKGTVIFLKDIQYLIKRNPISYHYSATLWYNTRVRAKEKEKQIPEYEYFVAAPFSGLNYLPLSQIKNEKDAAETGDAACENLDIMGYTGTYGQEIYKLNPEKSKILPYNKATLSKVKELMQKSRYVNLLTHGCVDKNEVNLVFYRDIDTTYSYLTIEDVFNLKMDADLVVMAACQSGHGEILNGEGMMSLTRGLLYSGANNIIYGLYPMKSSYMSELVYDFYKEYSINKNFSKAFQKAKITLMQNNSVRLKDWSSLILMGVD